MLSSAESWIEQEALVDMQKKVSYTGSLTGKQFALAAYSGPFSIRALKRRSRRDAAHSPCAKTRLNFYVALASIGEEAEVWLTWT